MASDIVIFDIEKAITLAAKALKGREDIQDRPRLLEAMAVAQYGSTEEERITAILFVAQDHGTLSPELLSRVYLSPIIKEALNLLWKGDYQRDSARFNFRIRKITEAARSEDEMKRESAELAKITFCHNVVNLEHQLRLDLYNLVSCKRRVERGADSDKGFDMGVKLDISILTDLLRRVSRQKKVMMDLFGCKYFPSIFY